MDLVFIQQFLGHASIQTTAIYLQVSGGRLLKELEKVENKASLKGNTQAVETLLNGLGITGELADQIRKQAGISQEM